MIQFALFRRTWNDIYLFPDLIQWKYFPVVRKVRAGRYGRTENVMHRFYEDSLLWDTSRAYGRTRHRPCSASTGLEPICNRDRGRHINRSIVQIRRSMNVGRVQSIVSWPKTVRAERGNYSFIVSSITLPRSRAFIELEISRMWS